MYVEPKIDWKTNDSPTATDFNRIEGNVKEIRSEVEDEIKPAINTINGIVATKAKIIPLINTTVYLSTDADTVINLPSYSGHRFYLISIYTSQNAVRENDLSSDIARLFGVACWWLTRYSTGDTITIRESAQGSGKTYIKVAYIE